MQAIRNNMISQFLEQLAKGMIDEHSELLADDVTKHDLLGALLAVVGMSNEEASEDETPRKLRKRRRKRTTMMTARLRLRCQTTGTRRR